MVTVTVELAGDILAACRAAGHAGAGRAGSDPVCAAVSVLLKTVGRTLADRPGVNIAGDAGQRGSLELRIDGWQKGDEEWMKGVTAFLVRGLKDAAEGSPGSIRLVIKNLERGCEDGT